VNADKVYYFDRLNDIDIVFPMAKAIMICLVVPVVLILIFRTERKHMKHEYQLA